MRNLLPCVRSLELYTRQSMFNYALTGSHPRVVHSRVRSSRQKYGRGREHRRSKSKPFVLLQAPLQVVLRAMVLAIRSLGNLQESYQKRPRGGHADLELEPPQDHLLHLEHLLSGVGVVRDVHAIPDLRRVYLFVLAGDQEGGHSYQLQLASVHVFLHAVSVDDVTRQVERWVGQFEFEVHLHDPVDQNRTHLAVDVELGVHVHRWGVLFLEIMRDRGTGGNDGHMGTGWEAR